MSADGSSHRGLRPVREDEEVPRPVIIGTGLAGLAVSRSLSRAGVRHVLVGQPPGSLPCLGESLNLEGTLGFQGGFSDLSGFFSAKKYAVAYLNDHAFSCPFDFSVPLLYRLLGYDSPASLLHIDRLSFDAALYRSVCDSACCTAFDDRVEELSYDTATDRIAAVHLSTGRTLPASYVFDATGHVRLLARALNLSCTLIGDRQRVAFTHYRVPEEAASGPFEDDWYHATTGVRLYPDVDGVDGFTWCIPLHRHVSVGVSTKADAADDLSDEALLEVTEQAYARHGVFYRRRYPEPTVVRGLKHHYFIHERAYGANWLLAGSSYCQVWWMAGAGAGAGLTAAQIAPKILKAPQKMGRRFQAHMQRLLDVHEAFEWLTASDRREISEAFIARHTDRFIIENMNRLMRSAPLQGSLLARVVGFVLDRLNVFEVLVKKFCEVRLVGPAAPAKAAAAPLHPAA